MQSTITITADDFGLTRGVTDTILETVDKGPVTHVGLIPNGEAVNYAIEEYKKRSERLTLTAHLNLTEGLALSPVSDIPFLVDSAGNFKYGVIGLWIAYSIAGSKMQLHFREQVRREIIAQLVCIREASGLIEIIVNSHQHVHLIPFVFDELVKLPGITRIRTAREPYQWSWSPISIFARKVLILLSDRATYTMRPYGITTNDSFIGFMHSGHMTQKIFHAALDKADGSIEASFHPGSAARDELVSWQGGRANIAWHYSSWRTKERAMLLHPGFITHPRSR